MYGLDVKRSSFVTPRNHTQILISIYWTNRRGDNGEGIELQKSMTELDIKNTPKTLKT